MENYKNSKIGRETAQKYGDILEMERPQTEESLRKHPRMTLQNRAKIFSPFSPLRGYDEQLAAEKQTTSTRCSAPCRWATPWCPLKIWWNSAEKASWTLMCIWASGKNEMARRTEREVYGTALSVK